MWHLAFSDKCAQFSGASPCGPPCQHKKHKWTYAKFSGGAFHAQAFKRRSRDHSAFSCVVHQRILHPIGGVIVKNCLSVLSSFSLTLQVLSQGHILKRNAHVLALFQFPHVFACEHIASLSLSLFHNYYVTIICKSGCQCLWIQKFMTLQKIDLREWVTFQVP